MAKTLSRQCESRETSRVELNGPGGNMRVRLLMIFLMAAAALAACVPPARASSGRFDNYFTNRAGPLFPRDSGPPDLINMENGDGTIIILARQEFSYRHFEPGLIEDQNKSLDGLFSSQQSDQMQMYSEFEEKRDMFLEDLAAPYLPLDEQLETLRKNLENRKAPSEF